MSRQRRRRRIRGGDRECSRACSRVDRHGGTGRTRAWDAHHRRQSSPNNVIAHVESTGARRRGSSSTVKASADDRRSRRGRRQEECVGVRRRRLDDFAEEGGDVGADREGRVTGTVNRQQVMNALEMEECRKIRRKKKYKMARPNGKLVVGARMTYKKKMKDGEIENYKCRLVT